MSAQLSDNLHQILDRFDDAWNSSPPPRIEDYLAEADPTQRLALLIELVRIDLERRLAAGERVRLEETYPRQRFPELYADSPALVTLVKHEYDLRRRNEPDLSPVECLERFPQYQAELRAQQSTLNDRFGEEQQKTAEIPVPGSALSGLDLRGYELIEELGRGAMGEVYRCCDPALGRDLAIKLMMAAHRGDAERERRFLREARVTGSLQHPGIVAVHNLGRLANGRLHYTMRLVRGRTLAAILKEDAGKPERLPDLLSIFEKICQAVAYAHSKHVIHRDLKPANVMVGRFGEVQVMDWGLAKVLAGADEPVSAEGPAEREGTRIQTEGGDTPQQLTRMGGEMGTLAYMPLEQALGEWDTVDERADVFALGSILCEILTGQPAYSGTDLQEMVRRVKRGDVSEALQRLQQCGMEAPLTELCRECLSPHREDRPHDAAVVAARVKAYLEELQARLRRAEVERAEAQLKAREGRKQRRLLIALVLALLAGAGLSTWQAVRATLAEAKVRENEKKALAERDEKEIALGNTKAVLDFLQSTVLKAARPKAQEGGLGVNVTLRQAVEKAEKDINDSLKGHPLLEGSIRNTLGKTYWYWGDYPQAVQQYKRALALREAKLGPEAPETLQTRDALANAYLSDHRSDEAIRLHKQNLPLCEATLGHDNPHTLRAIANLGAAYRDAGRLTDAIHQFEEALERGRKRAGGLPIPIAWVPGALAAIHERVGQFDKSEIRYRDLLEQARRQFGAEDPRTAAQMATLGLNLLHQGKYTYAETLLRDCLKVRTAKQADDWATFNARSLLGAALLGQKKYAEAEPLLVQGYEGMTQRAAKIPPQGKVRLTEALQRLVQLYEATGKKDAAAKYRKQLDETKAAQKKPKP